MKQTNSSDRHQGSRPTDQQLADGYRQMAADREREAEAHEWCEALIGDVADESEPMSAGEKERLFADAVKRAHWDDPEFDVYDEQRNSKRR